MLENTTAKSIRSQDDISKLLIDLGGQEYYPEEYSPESGMWDYPRKAHNSVSWILFYLQEATRKLGSVERVSFSGKINVLYFVCLVFHLYSSILLYAGSPRTKYK